MKVSGFTFVRDAIKYDYPVVEAITSVLPLCDDLIVNVGKSEDRTLELIESMNDKRIKIIESEWAEIYTRTKHVYSDQTNIALSHCTGDWAFYIQADEVVHENDYDTISKAIAKNYHRKQIVGLRFKFLHFEGNYHYVHPLRYRRQIRIIRNNGEVKSYRDACGFSYRNKTIPFYNYANINAFIYHYGWVSPHKTRKEMEICRPFKGTHPAVMKKRIEKSQIELPKFKHIPLPLSPIFYRRTLRKIGILRRKKF